MTGFVLQGGVLQKYPNYKIVSYVFVNHGKFS